MPGEEHDLLLVGAGLANGLLALRLRALHPRLRLRVLERESAPAGNHTWSFHDADLTDAQRAWVMPLASHRWPAQSVRFPGFSRRFDAGYASIASHDFARTLRDALGDALIADAAVLRVSRHEVLLADGRRLRARAVVDGRGFQAVQGRALRLGFQRFLGQELRLAAPHGLQAPVIMDATVDQHEGYRFVYLLPFSPTGLLVEDTYYADDATLDVARLRARIAAYAAAQGWTVDAVLREETGVLPIVLDGDPGAFWPDDPDAPARSGLAAGLFHPVTGYSLPDAVRLAHAVAALPDPADAQALVALTRGRFLSQWRAHGYFRMLNRMLFLAATPGERRAVLARFHRLPHGLIRRFYAGTPTFADRLRILAGRPPVPVGRALRAVLDRTRPVNIQPEKAP